MIQTESPYFKKILDTMYHSKVNEGRDFLCLVDNVIARCDKYPANCDGSISLHIIYLPTCPPWARELLVRFLIHRSTLTQDKTILPLARRITSGPLDLPMGMKGSSKSSKLLKEERTYYKNILRNFSELGDIAETKRTLFVLSENDVITRGDDKNPWLSKLYSRELGSEEATIVTTELNAYDIEQQIREFNKNSVPQFENIYVFHSPNKGRITSSYNIEQIQRLNQFGVGIKNIYIFYIAEHPYRLYYADETIKRKILSNVLKKEIKKYDTFNGFISFAPNEIDSLFHRESKRATLTIDPPDRDIFTSGLDAVFDQMQHNYRIKNNLSLALTRKLQDLFVSTLKQDVGYVPDDDLLSQFFQYYERVWGESIKPQINQFIAGSKHVTILIHRKERAYKTFLQEQFKSEGKQIDVKLINDVKKGIKSECVILFTYRYTDSTYRSFPNSFDPLPIMPDQSSLTIINRLTHNNYFEWNSYHYRKDYNGFLYSEFRKKELGWCVGNYTKPVIPDIWDIIEEAESDQRNYQAEKCSVVYDTERRKDYFASTKALYLKDNGKYGVCSLKDLSDADVKELLVIDELVSEVRDSLISKSNKDISAEEIIRKDPKYGLTPDEINSNVELWKYLLIKKIKEFGEEAVYSDIFHQSQEIKIQGFKRWTDLNYPMILPRSRKSQNALLTYLGFTIGSPYHKIVLSKKLLSINNSRTLNAEIETLLEALITKKVETADDFESLLEKNTDILTVLEITTPAEANTLIDLLDINLKKIIRIEYDTD